MGILPEWVNALKQAGIFAGIFAALLAYLNYRQWPPRLLFRDFVFSIFTGLFYGMVSTFGTRLLHGKLAVMFLSYIAIGYFVGRVLLPRPKPTTNN
jgi:hypothetical protein